MNSNDANSPCRRRQQHQQRRNLGGIVGTAVTTALAVYGTYHLAIWAWNAWNDTPPATNSSVDHDNEEEEMNAENDNTKTQHRHQQQPQQQQHHHLSTTTEQQHHHLSTTTDQIRQQEQERIRSYYMSQCRRQTSSTLAAFSTILLKKIDTATDTTKIRQQLKQIRKCKLQSNNDYDTQTTTHPEEEASLWMSIQVETVTRLLSLVYAYTLLYTTLTIQVHRLGGHMYHNNNNNHSSCSRSNDGASELEGYRALIQSYDAFWEYDGGDGGGKFLDLIKRVRSAVQIALTHWNIHHPTFSLQMTVSHVHDAITLIRNSVERNRDMTLLQEFIIPSNNDGTNYNDANGSTLLLNEMYDLLESPVANDALKDALQCVFTLLQEQYIDPIFSDIETSDCNSTTPVAVVVRPLPHVISQLKAMTSGFITRTDSTSKNNKQYQHEKNHANGASSSHNSYDRKNNEYINALEQLPSIQDVAKISFGSFY